MLAHQFPVSEIGLKPLVRDYLKHDVSAHRLVQFAPTLNDVLRATERRNDSYSYRAKFSSVLLSQYETVSIDDNLRQNIESFRDNNSFAVVTGHQLCLFTGPLYTICKIASAIALARRLNHLNSGKRFVPVFWMATEDHDLAEIDHVHLAGTTLKWPTTEGVVAGRLSTKNLSGIIDEVQLMLGSGPHTEDTISMLRECYSAPNHAAAFRRLVHALFGKYGLVTVDGDNPEFKSWFVPAMRDELLNQTTLHRVSETNDLIAHLGHEAQVNPRPINLFFLSDRGRVRIEVEENGGYKLADGSRTWNRHEMLAELESNPRSFSPNVLLRPLYQETILPGVAYVGGQAEVAYWLQLKSLFSHHNLPMPAVFLRDSALIVSSQVKRLLQKLELTTTDLIQPKEQIVKQRLMSSVDTSLDTVRRKLEEARTEALSAIQKVDTSLEGMVNAEFARMGNSINSMEKRIEKAMREREQVRIRQLDKLFEAIKPNGEMQERYANYFDFRNEFGDGLIDLLVEHMNPAQPRLHVVSR